MMAYTCVKKFYPKGSNIWIGGRQTCGRPAKFWVDAGGPSQCPMCGVHANKSRREGRKVEPISTPDEATAVQQ